MKITHFEIGQYETFVLVGEGWQSSFNSFRETFSRPTKNGRRVLIHGISDGSDCYYRYREDGVLETHPIWVEDLSLKATIVF